MHCTQRVSRSVVNSTPLPLPIPPLEYLTRVPEILAVLQSLFNHLREAHNRRDVEAIVVTGANGTGRLTSRLPLPS